MSTYKNLFILLRAQRDLLMCGKLSRLTKTFQIELRIANQIGRLILYDSTLHNLICLKVIVSQ